MKLCYFYNDITLKGGIERVLSLLTTEQVKNPHLEITLVSQYKSFHIPHYPFSEQIKIVYLSDQPYGGMPGSFHRFILQLKKRKSIRLFFRKNNFDLIASQAFPNTFMLCMAGIDMKKVISVEHVYYGYYNRLIRTLRLYIYRKLQAVVVLTNKDEKKFSKYLPAVFTIPNPVILDNRFHSLLEANKIVSIGRLEYQKGYDTLIKVFHELYKKYPDWVVEIYGEGTLKEELERQIAKYDLSACFHLRGTMENVLEKLREASFFVMSSRFEGFPMVLLEAMSQGVPCISFDCPNGPSDIITHEQDGLLVENQNETALKEGMERLMSGYNLRKKFGDAAYSKVEVFDIKTITEKWNNLYALLGMK